MNTATQTEHQKIGEYRKYLKIESQCLCLPIYTVWGEYNKEEESINYYDF